MMDRSNAPFSPPDPEHISKVLNDLEQHAKRGGRRGIRKKNYAVDGKPGRIVTSWSVPDFDYKKSGLPTYARGLFTHKNNGVPEIACRGYDKFFNVNEVRATEWANVEKYTRGPYELSVKENGCIIFIGTLDDETILVTSKHSTGPREDTDANHALVGERWLDKQLATLGKTRADLAKRLRSMNATAVAELCDDEFEEHVLQYEPHQAGLYLHGINLNLPEFATYPGNLVHQFADEWGFRRVTYVMEDDINEVKRFLDKIAETGNYAGRDTEGFVIRCQAQDGPNLPYHDWFFKYKFEEPYLMYRQWREVTRAVIAGKVPKFKKHRAITEEYIIYARQQLHKDPNVGRLFNKNHGIIAMREGFLQYKGVKGSDIIRSEEADGDIASSNIAADVVLVPVATIGCGKTTLAIAAAKLFGWGHEQNDNIQGKQRRPQRFAAAVTTAMQAFPVVIADRNNHQRREREQIIQDVRQIVPSAKFVALHYVHDRGNYDDIRRIMRERVLSRGDNHQTIQAGSKGPSEIIEIMEGFMHRFEPVDVDKHPDSQFDLVIDLDVAAGSRENLETVISQLHEEYPSLMRMPTSQEMDDAIEYALSEYRPDIKHDLSSKGGNNKDKKGQKQAKTEPAKPPKRPEVEYFGVQLETSRVDAVLDSVFSSSNPEKNRFYKQLKSSRRLQKEFHVTLLHRAETQANRVYWDTLIELWQQKTGVEAATGDTSSGNGQSVPDYYAPLGTCRVQLERVVWNDRVMAIMVRLLSAESGPEFHSTNGFPHITVGTAGDGIKPVESNKLLQAWQEGSDPAIKDAMVKGQVVLEGTIRGVLRR